MAPRKVRGSTTTPKSMGTVRGSNLVPKVRPSAPEVRQARGVRVTRTGQLTCRWTGVAGTRAATGNTMRAATSPWMAPETIFPTATQLTGMGASTRSSISLV